MGAAAPIPEAARPAPDPLAALARRADPADAGAQNNLGVLLHRRGRPEAALHAFARALALDPAMRLARRNLAAADGGTGDRREAELRARLRVDGADFDARRELARLLSALGRHDAARAELDALAALAPEAPGVHVERARAEQAAGDVDAAAEALERARALAPSSATVRALLAHVTYHAGDPAAALAHVEAALRLAPDDAEAHLLRGFLLGELGRPADGDAARARAVSLNPALGRADANLALAPTADAPPGERAGGAGYDAHLVLGAAFRHKGYHDEALREYRRAAALGAPEATIARAVGEAQLLRGSPEAAVVPWTRLTALAPEDAGAWLGRAGAAHLAGRPDEARAAYERTLALAPRDGEPAAWAHNGLGALRWAAGDLAGAAQAFAEAAARAPHAAAPRQNHATALGAMGDGARAVAAARDVVRDAPGRASAWTLLGALLAEARRPADARGAFARALDLDPDDVAARYGLAFAAAALGDHDVARRETERALARTAIVPGRRLTLVLDLGGAMEFGIDAPDVAPAAAAVAGFVLDERAADALVAELLAPRSESDAAGDGAPGPHAYALADEHLAHGDVERAEAAVSRALARGGDRAEGLARQGAIHARRGLHGEALERFADARALAPGLQLAALGEVRALRELGRMREARDAAAVMAAAWPGDAAAQALAALAHADADDAAGALALLARAGAGARDAATWRDLAAAWRALGDAEGALAAQTRVVECAPSDPRERLALADAQHAADRAADAERTLRALLADAPALADAALALASLRVAAGVGAEAVPLLAGVVARDPWHVDALARLGAVLADAGRPRDAAMAASRARRLDPEHALALAVEGDCRFAVGQRARAVACWRAVLALEPVGAGADRARSALRAAGEAP
jgi:tetratricopeptide (TPR) repeat protein